MIFGAERPYSNTDEFHFAALNSRMTILVVAGLALASVQFDTNAQLMVSINQLNPVQSIESSIGRAPVGPEFGVAFLFNGQNPNSSIQPKTLSFQGTFDAGGSGPTADSHFAFTQDAQWTVALSTVGNGQDIKSINPFNGNGRTFTFNGDDTRYITYTKQNVQGFFLGVEPGEVGLVNLSFDGLFSGTKAGLTVLSISAIFPRGALAINESSVPGAVEGIFYDTTQFGGNPNYFFPPSASWSYSTTAIPESQQIGIAIAGCLTWFAGHRVFAKYNTPK